MCVPFVEKDIITNYVLLTVDYVEAVAVIKLG